MMFTDVKWQIQIVRETDTFLQSKKKQVQDNSSYLIHN